MTVFCERKTRFKSIFELMELSHDVICKDKERMTKIQTSVEDNQQDGYRIKSIVDGLGKKGFSSVFSEASRRTIKEMDNIEFFELGETVRTTQCPSCLRYSQEGTFHCLCGKCLMPSFE